MSIIKRVSIYDLDGTIICSLHRYRTIVGSDGVTRIDLPYWRANEHRAMDDSLRPLASLYREDIADPNTYVVIATARVLHRPDREFIRTRLGMPNHLISRPDGFEGSGAHMKVSGLERLFSRMPHLLRAADVSFYEDNRSYLAAVTTRFPSIRGVFVPSTQGH